MSEIKWGELIWRLIAIEVDREDFGGIEDQTTS